MTSNSRVKVSTGNQIQIQLSHTYIINIPVKIDRQELRKQHGLFLWHGNKVHLFRQQPFYTAYYVLHDRHQCSRKKNHHSDRYSRQPT